MIIVDTREFRSKVVKELFNNDIEMQSLQLLVGDYLIGEDVCVERKSVKDFVDSLIDKRLFEQLKRMKEEYRKPILIVEGVESVYSARKVHPNAIRGLLATILLEFNVPIFFSNNEEDTAGFLITLMNRMDKEPKPVIKTSKGVTNKEVQENIVQSLPGVGVKAGKNLLKSFKKLNSLFNAGVEELLKVEGVGEKTAEKIVEVITEEYKD